MSEQHEYKIWPAYFDAVADGSKPFDVRKLDPERKPVNVGDVIRFREWGPVQNPPLYTLAAGTVYMYTKRETLKRVTYVLHGDGTLLPLGYIVMGLAAL